MLATKKIAVVTGSRAEYGLLYWLMKDIECDPVLNLQTIVTGMHLSREFGLTIKNIEQDGFTIHAKVDALLAHDSPVAVTKAIGLGIIGFADAYENLKPDLVVLLGDRFEIFAAAQATLFAKIPIAHIHGGELTLGAVDEHIRHAITKLSHLHFVAAKEYEKRVIQLGESPDRVFCVGAAALDHIQRKPLYTRQELENVLNFKLGSLNFLVTLHPATLENISIESFTNALLTALEHFPDAKIIFTLSNADPGGRLISSLIQNYSDKDPKRCAAFVTLGSQKYLSALKHSDIIIGNSSSGLIEAPFFKKAVVNIGTRQDGRLKAINIIDCGYTTHEIKQAIDKALVLKDSSQIEKTQSLYGSGNASKEIIKIIKSTDLKKIIHKKFYDLPVNVEELTQC